MTYEGYVTTDCIRLPLRAPRLSLLLALAALAGTAACKEDTGMTASVDDPSTSSDAAVAAPDTGTGLPPFTLPTFPRRDAAVQQPPRDAGTTPPAPVARRVGAAGGLLADDRGIAVDVPEGALTREIQITFAELPSPPAGFVGKAWLISPPTTRFAKPAKVAIQLSAELLAQAPGSEWVVSTLVNGAWVPLSNVGNDANDILSFGFTDTLGPFALTRRVPGEAGVPDASVEDAGEDATVDAEVDAGAPVPVCTADACANGICIQGATNYACMCNTGFAAAADQHSCVAVDPCAAVVCTGGKTCSAGACACPTGTAEDATGVCAAPPVDPCAAVVCLTGNVCTAGVCACMTGLVAAADGTCAAPTCASTCAAPNTCVGEVCTPPAPTLYCPAGACENGACVEGAADYSCTCTAGFTAAADAKSCTDIDECTAGTSTCVAPATCTNTPGAFTCACAAPNTLAADGVTCTPPAPMTFCPVAPATPVCTNGTCAEGAADYSCTCNPGYAAAADGKSCADIDECATMTSTCVAPATCTNTVGSFTCTCDAPNTLGADGVTCTAPAVPPAMPPTMPAM